MKLYDRPFNFSRFRCDRLGQTKVGIEIETAGPNECSKNYSINMESGQGSLCEVLTFKVRFK